MNNIFRRALALSILFFVAICANAQVLEQPTISKRDSAIIAAPVVVKKFSPRRAASLSAMIPGAGQIYNKRYWKVPLVYGGLITFGYLVVWNNNRLIEVNDGLEDFFDENPDTRSYDNILAFTKDQFIANGHGNEASYNAWAESVLKNGRRGYRRNRDLSALGFAAFYLLQILDASIDAHFKNFDISDDLSLNIDPIQQQNPLSGRPVYGLSCKLTF